MKERPIIFSGPMVRAILDGSKTQTRRVIKRQPIERESVVWMNGWHYWMMKGSENDLLPCRCPYGAVGDRLWVREAWQYADWTEDGEPIIRYRADGREEFRAASEEWADRLVDIWAKLSEPENYDIDRRAADRRWRPLIHMPRWASRITLEITEVRAQRLQEISPDDVEAEGVEIHVCSSMSDGMPCQCGNVDGDETDVETFAELWDSINAKRGYPWESDPWVWALTFEVVK